AEDALRALSAEGARLAVCTNKRTDLSVQLLQTLGLAELFSAIVGADAVEHRKPHPDHYRAAVARAGGSVDRSLLVGDTAIEFNTARNAGAPIILVRFGYIDAAELSLLAADAIIDHYSELAPLCRTLVAAP